MVLKPVLSAVIVVLLLAGGYFSYFFLFRSAAAPGRTGKGLAQTGRVIQLDVLNGSGAKGIAARFTKFLRNAGFDVVEMKNYKVSTISRTLVVDRVGDLSSARRVALALGVGDKSIIQQINPDYFVDVSVIIGGDYASLQSFH